MRLTISYEKNPLHQSGEHKKKSDRRDSNPRPPPWQGGVLPTVLLSHSKSSKEQVNHLQSRAITYKAGDGNRTHVSSLEGWCSTIELHLQKYFS